MTAADRSPDAPAVGDAHVDPDAAASVPGIAPVPWIDWPLAERVGHRLVPAGPTADPAQIASLVDELRAVAREAPALVADATGLPVPEGPGSDHVLVVDRRGWVSANALTARDLMRQLGAPQRSSGLGRRVAGRALASQVGGLFALLGSRVLGHYDPFCRGRDGLPMRRLVLVAPNVLDVERRLNLVPTDFRRWVALHEQTHRVQFHAAPWLADHLVGLMGTFMAQEAASGDGFADLVGRAGRVLGREGEATASSSALIDLVVAPASREALERVTAVMSLLEGHADVVMDLAGAPVIDSLPTIRQRFEARRDAGGMTALIGRLTAMDAKLAQYRQGAAFCRGVIDRVGMSGLNRVFEAPELLPDAVEIDEPWRWVQRVHPQARP